MPLHGFLNECNFNRSMQIKKNIAIFCHKYSTRRERARERLPGQHQPRPPFSSLLWSCQDCDAHLTVSLFLGIAQQCNGYWQPWYQLHLPKRLMGGASAQWQLRELISSEFFELLSMQVRDIKLNISHCQENTICTTSRWLAIVASGYSIWLLYL